MGEASNPGPDREVEGVAPTQEDSDTHGSGVVHHNLIQRTRPLRRFAQTQKVVVLRM